MAEHWWTMENPREPLVRCRVRGARAHAGADAGDGDVAVALGVAEVVTPDLTPSESGPPSRTCSPGWRGRGHGDVLAVVGDPLGSVDLDSNLPDFRIALGGPSVNAFTAEVLSACDPAVAKRLAQLVAEGGAPGCGCRRPGRARRRSRQGQTCAGRGTCRC